MATDKSVVITLARGKAIKDGFRYDSTSAIIRGSLYLNAEASKGVTMFDATLTPHKA